jgi:hypothetical protein
MNASKQRKKINSLIEEQKLKPKAIKVKGTTPPNLQSKLDEDLLWWLLA